MMMLAALSCQDMVSQVSTMLKTVKNVEEESGKVVRSLENTIDSISSGLSEFSSKDFTSDATPEELIRTTKVRMQVCNFLKESFDASDQTC